ncbi:hypothetical protein CHH74_00345 [Shouchella clausii]|nr:hypothetical protein CHH74_00345 [Shouchella clausii]
MYLTVHKEWEWNLLEKKSNGFQDEFKRARFSYLGKEWWKVEIKRAVTNKRAVTLLFVFLGLFTILLGRMAYIQITKEVKGHDLVAMAEAKYNRSQVLESERGAILDRHGSVLAEDVPAYNVIAVLSDSQGPTQYVKDPQETAQKLAPLIGMEEGELEARLTDGKENGRFQIELGAGARNLTYEQKNEIEALNLPGILIQETKRRYYPKQTFASHVIGHHNSEDSAYNMGLEASMNDYLHAEDGHIEYASLGKGLSLGAGSDRVTLPKNGADIYTTLDTSIQAAMEQAMSQVEAEYEPEKMTAIAADPRTGEILAMSNRPSFNPNDYRNIENYLNLAVQDVVEPGSTMKMFTIAAAIEEGEFEDDSTYQSGRYEVDANSPPINDVNRSGWGEISYAEGFQRSSNVLMAKLVLERLGMERFYSYLKQFGFTEQTGIDLANEASSNVVEGRRADAARTAFGQNSTVTAIQMIQAATAIAGDGKMKKPYIIKEIVDENGDKIRETEPEVAGEPISEETAKHVRELLRGAVAEDHGTGKAYNIQGLEVAGKTGTAQIAEDGKYLSGHGQYLYSFLGMAPADNPKVILYVSVTKPKLDDNESGNAPVSMIFNAVMQSSMTYMDLEPNEEELLQEAEEQGFEMPQLAGEQVDKAAETIPGEVVVLGEGEHIKDQQPAPGTKVLPGDRIVLLTDGEVKMPDMAGWSSRDAMKVAALLDLTPEFKGNGYLQSQSIAPGEPVEEQNLLNAEFASNNERDEQEDHDQGGAGANAERTDEELEQAFEDVEEPVSEGDEEATTEEEESDGDQPE